MLEALLSGKKKSGLRPPDPNQDANTLLFMDMSDLTDLSMYQNAMTVSGTGVIGSVGSQVDGTPSFFSNTTGYISTTNLANIVKAIGTGDYTIEFDYYNSKVAGGYKSVFYCDNLFMRFGDGGFSNRLQYGPNQGSLAGIYGTQYTVTTLPAGWNNIRIMRKSGQVYLYINQVLQTVRSGNYTGSPVTSYADTINWGTLSVFKLGYVSTVTTAGAEGAYFDNFRISNVARY